MIKKLCQVTVSCLMLIFLSGCFAFPRAPANRPEKRYLHHETFQKEPRVVQITDSQGKKLDVSIGDAIYTEYDVNLTTPQKKKTIWGKLWGIFGFWTIILVLIAIFVPGGLGLVSMILGRIMKMTRKGMGQAVVGIERYLQQSTNEEEKRKLLSALSQTMDNPTKKMVSEIKLNGGAK